MKAYIYSYNTFQTIDRVNRIFESELQQLDEGAPAWLTNPGKWIKIKNWSKKLEDVNIKQSLLDIDLAKKLAKIKGDPERRESLRKVADQKRRGLNNKEAAIKDRLDDIATTEPLRKLVVLVKNKAELVAAEELLKAADAAEAKILTKRIQSRKAKIKDIQDELDKIAMEREMEKREKEKREAEQG